MGETTKTRPGCANAPDGSPLLSRTRGYPFVQENPTMAHNPLPGLYCDLVTRRVGTVTLYPDFDAVMFQPRTGQDRPDQFSPDVAGKRLRLVTSASQRRGIAGTTYSEEPIDWDAKLNALRDPAGQKMADTVAANLAGLRARAESFLLADDMLDATQRQTGAHDAAMRILGYGGKDTDPRTTMRGELARLQAEVQTAKARLYAACDGPANSADMAAERTLSEVVDETIAYIELGEKTTDPSRLTPSEIANLRAIWADPDAGHARAVKWYRERFTPYRGLSEALRDVRVILGLPTVSLEERVEAIQHADRMRTAERAMSEEG